HNESLGVLEATAGGTLDVKDTLTNDLGGIVEATGTVGHVSTVTLEANVVNNGQLEALAYGTLDFNPPSASQLTVTNNKATNGIVLAANGTLQFEVATLELLGSGGVQLTGGTITGTGSNIFDNDGNTIAGYGLIESLKLQNGDIAASTINANVSTKTLTLDTGSNTILNESLGVL